VAQGGPIQDRHARCPSRRYAQYGIQAPRPRSFSQDIKGKGILGRPVEFIYEDTEGIRPRGAQGAEAGEKDGVSSSPAWRCLRGAGRLSAKCPSGKVIFMSTINGAGSLTTKSFHRYFFRVNTSGPIGARAISLYLAEGPMKKFFRWRRLRLGA